MKSLIQPGDVSSDGMTPGGGFSCCSFPLPSLVLSSEGLCACAGTLGLLLFMFLQPVVSHHKTSPVALLNEILRSYQA